MDILLSQFGELRIVAVSLIPLFGYAIFLVVACIRDAKITCVIKITIFFNVISQIYFLFILSSLHESRFQIVHSVYFIGIIAMDLATSVLFIVLSRQESLLSEKDFSDGKPKFADLQKSGIYISLFTIIIALISVLISFLPDRFMNEAPIFGDLNMLLRLSDIANSVMTILILAAQITVTRNGKSRKGEAGFEQSFEKSDEAPKIVVQITVNN